MAETIDNKDSIEIFSSLLPPLQETEHIKPTGDIDGDPTYSISASGQNTSITETKGELRLATFSFRLNSDEFDIENYFNVEKTTGILKDGFIEIQITEDEMFNQLSTFRFTDRTASDDASLKTLVLSRGETNEDPELDTYKEYELTPTFNSSELNYTREILEYIDDLDLKLQTNDTKASVKIKIPKRDVDTGELVYLEDGTLDYEEKEITQDENGAKLNIKLNELGKENTKITIIVTSESKKQTNEYIVDIKRPFATIKGSIFTAPTAEIEKYTANIKIYKTEEIEAVIDLEDSTNKANFHSTLETLTSRDYQTKEDGTYEIYVVPGKYDILIDKAAYLDQIFIRNNLTEGNTKDFGQIELLAGDINKDGVVNQRDLSLISNGFGSREGQTIYDENPSYDLDENKVINQRDISAIANNFLKKITVEQV